jgi:hypothetical protein
VINSLCRLEHWRLSPRRRDHSQKQFSFQARPMCLDDMLHWLMLGTTEDSKVQGILCFGISSSWSLKMSLLPCLKVKTRPYAMYKS